MSIPFLSAEQNVAKTGGTLDNCTVGSVTPAAGTFTNVTATGQILGANAGNKNAPDLSFNGVSASGMYWTGNAVAISSAGVLVAAFSTSTTTLLSLSLNGNAAASSPVAMWNGSLYTGGTGTTTVPSLLYANQGATNPTTFSTSGTYIGINSAAAFVGNFLHFFKNGVTEFSVSSTGIITGLALNVSGAITATAFTETLYTATYAATLTINWASSNNQKLTLTGNSTITFSNAVAGQTLTLELIQDSTGSRTVTWSTTIRWQGGTAPTLTTTASKIDLITISYDGTNYYGYSRLNF